MIKDIKRVETKEFEKASNKRYTLERRIAAKVKKHGLRRSRYLRLKGAKINIALANMACNIVRMVNVFYPPGIAIS